MSLLATKSDIPSPQSAIAAPNKHPGYIGSTDSTVISTGLSGLGTTEICISTKIYYNLEPDIASEQERARTTILGASENSSGSLIGAVLEEMLTARHHSQCKHCQPTREINYYRKTKPIPGWGRLDSVGNI